MSATRDTETATPFFLKTLVVYHPATPRVINVDNNAAYPKAFKKLKGEGHLSASGEMRRVTYLSNLIEQDHRCIKRLTKPGMGFFSFKTAWRTLRGCKMMNMRRKGQGQGVAKGDGKGQVVLVARLFGGVAYIE